jgi:hypothetical protein
MTPDQRLVAPPVSGSHGLQLFDDAHSRTETVGTFLADGWREGDTLLVVASAVHWVGIAQRLDGLGVPVAMALSSGRLTVRDARVTLDQFRRHERLDPARFEAVIASLVRTLVARGRPVRVFGEMVDLLAGAGDYAGAEHLEQLWNGLAARYPFTLLCGYSAATFGDPRSRASLRSICAAHGQVRTDPADLLGSFLIDAAHRG